MSKKPRSPVTIVQVSESCRSKVRDIVVRKLSERVLEEGLNRCGSKVTEDALLSYVDGALTEALDSLFSGPKPEAGETASANRIFKGKVLENPVREDIRFPIQEQLIVELYSR